MSRIALTHSYSEVPTADPGGTWFDVELADGSVERVDDAHAYQQEQSMTTFFRTDGGRQRVDSWSVRVKTSSAAPFPIASGSGACTRIPSHVSSAFSMLTCFSTSARDDEAGMR